MRESFWRGRDVFVTGHTGFKGAWLVVLLARLGARIHGYALDTPSDFLYQRAALDGLMRSDHRADIRDTAALEEAVRDSGADVVLHLAAQTVVRDGYEDPMETFSTNVMGTASVLQAVRGSPAVTRCVVVTTDKVYRNREWAWAYRETDELGGDDPYSASKAAAEIVTHSMAVSFPREGLAVATARAGNVIAGGDATAHALIPELVESFAAGRPARLRAPGSVRPWQFILEPLGGYLTLAERLGPGMGDTAWNFGPSPDDVRTVGDVADLAVRYWGDGARWETVAGDGPHEAGRLTLDSTRAREELGWRPRTTLDDAVRLAVAFEKATRAGSGPREVMEEQVSGFLGAVDGPDSAA